MSVVCEEGFIVNGNHKASPTNLMDELDKSVAQTVTLTKGTLWVIGTSIAAASVIILILAYVISGAMGYQGVVNRLGQAETRLDKIEKTLDEFSQMKITLNNVQNDSKIIRETQAANESDRKEMMKNLSDIRILLAQRGMQ